MLDASLDALNRGFSQFRAGWYSRLHEALKPQLLAERLVTVYETLERPLVPVLTDMELAGIKVDRDTLSRMTRGPSA